MYREDLIYVCILIHTYTKSLEGLYDFMSKSKSKSLFYSFIWILFDFEVYWDRGLDLDLGLTILYNTKTICKNKPLKGRLL